MTGLDWGIAIASATGLLVAGIVVFFGYPATASGIVGGIALSALNYWAWKKIVSRLIAGTAVKRAAPLFMLKIAANGLAVFVLIRFIQVGSAGFLVGIGAGILGLVVSGLLSGNSEPSPSA